MFRPKFLSRYARRSLVFSSAFLFLTQGLQAQICAPPPPGIVGWWDGDAIAGTTADDIQGSNQGTMLGGMGLAPGIVGQAFSLDGGDDSIDVGLDPSLDIASGDHSVVTWARWTQTTGNARAFINLGGFQQRFMLSTSFNSGGQGKVAYGFASSAGGGGASGTWFYNAGSGLNDGLWHHIAATKAGSTVQIYVDGVSVGFSVGTVGFLNSNVIGHGFHGNFNGDIDELALFERALSAAEVQAIYDARSAGMCKTPADPDPPVVSIDSPLDGAVLGASSVLLETTVTDDSATTVVSTPAGIDTTLPAGGGSTSGTVALVEGLNNLSVTATDDAGNVGGTTVAVTSDTIAPDVTVLSPLDGAVFGMSPAPLSISVVDATGTTVEFGADSVALAAGGGTASGDVDLVEGSNPITVTTTDEAGNATVVSLTVILDLTAPIVTIDSPADGACFGPGESPIAVTATVDDLTETDVESAPSGVTGTLPAGGGIAMGAVALVEGPNTITVTATDATTQQGSAGIIVILDTTAPDLSLDAPSDGATVRGSIDFDVTVVDVLPGSGVAQVDFRVDGNLVASLTAEPFELDYDTTVLADGSYDLSVEAFDGKGNSATASAIVLVDNTAPTITILAPLDGEIISGTMSIDASADDGGAGLVEVEMLVRGAPPNQLDGSVVFGTPQGSALVTSLDDTTLRGDGTLLVSVRALDAVGNETIATATVTVDNQAPTKTLVAPAHHSTVSGVIDIIADSTTADLESLEIVVDGVSLGTQTFAPFQLSYDTTTRLDGAMEVMVVARDLAGNSSSCAALVRIDNVRVTIRPRVINGRWRKPGGLVRARLAGPNLDLMQPTSAHDIKLLIPGGNPVPLHSDNMFNDRLVLKFERRQLLSSVRAGICAGVIQPNSRFGVRVSVDGNIVGADRMFIIGGAD
ncbi:MAG: hypothetical protein GY711_06915 [bacterium]|nr:hypothetical protein [bacterium]